jgi:hypothetical protein
MAITTAVNIIVVTCRFVKCSCRIRPFRHRLLPHEAAVSLVCQTKSCAGKTPRSQYLPEILDLPEILALMLRDDFGDTVPPIDVTVDSTFILYRPLICPLKCRSFGQCDAPAHPGARSDARGHSKFRWLSVSMGIADETSPRR